MQYGTLKILIGKIKTEENRALLISKIESSNKLSFIERSELLSLTYSVKL